MKCEHCPVESSQECPGQRVRGLCGWVEPGGPRYHTQGAATLVRMASGATELPPRMEATASASAVVAPPVAPTIPLAGDLVAAATKRLGADRLARWIEAKVGVDCGCESRREALNRLDEKLRCYLSGASKSPAHKGR
jgi:hypothetical protein